MFFIFHISKHYTLLWSIEQLDSFHFRLLWTNSERVQQNFLQGKRSCDQLFHYYVLRSTLVLSEGVETCIYATKVMTHKFPRHFEHNLLSLLVKKVDFFDCITIKLCNHHMHWKRPMSLLSLSIRQCVCRELCTRWLVFSGWLIIGAKS